MGNATSRRHNKTTASETSPDSPQQSVCSCSSETSSSASDASPKLADDSTDDLVVVQSNAPAPLSSLNKNLVFNSCWTVNADCTASNPNLRSTLLCVSHLVVKEIKRNYQAGDNRTEPMFEDENFKPDELPAETAVFAFLEVLFRVVGLRADSAIIALVYVHRILKQKKVALSATNWRRLLIGGVVVASKVWDDQCWFNFDICSVFPYIQASELNALERFYLSAMDFDVNVKVKLFTMYYFMLRDVAIESEIALSMPEMDAPEFQQRAKAYTSRVNPNFRDSERQRSNDLRRTVSDNNFKVKPRTYFVF